MLNFSKGKIICFLLLNPLALLGILFLSVQSVSADDDYNYTFTQTDFSYNTSFASDYLYKVQRFTGSGYQIKSINYYVTSGTSSIEFYFCPAGTIYLSDIQSCISSSSYLSNNDCDGSGSNEWKQCFFDDDYTFLDGTDYTLIIVSENSNLGAYNYGYSVSPYNSFFLHEDNYYESMSASVVFALEMSDYSLYDFLDTVEDEINYIDFSDSADFNGSGFLNFEPNIICDTDNPCEFKFRYYESQINKTVCVINDDDYNDYGSDLNYFLGDYGDYDDCIVLTEQVILNESLFLDALATTTGMDYTVLVYDSDDLISEFYTLSSVWYQDGLDTVFSELDAYMDTLPSYNIDSACQFVSTSTGSYSDDFRYGIECGFNKTLYWLFTPKDEVYSDLYKAKDVFLNEFPINLFNILLSRIKQGSIVSDNISFELPLYVGSFTESGSVVMWSSDDLVNKFGQTWLNIYNFFQTAIYFITIIYFVSWISRRY